MKIAIIINNNLPIGLITNTASVLGISLGRTFPEIVRETVNDAQGNEYAGITSLNIPILSATGDKIKEIVSTARLEDDLTLIPFTEVAQRSRDYDSYKEDISKISPDNVSYSGIAIVGSNKKVARYTGSLPLLR
ncbi:DUF2000 domain-containing protein [Spirochaeta cellobiosiphila]|uniref:DUF2000 domain-containing protein n=1 Tax=Spirochaeta cellobiosiphila TaxID=504483 RepID=UPI000419599D|nr:DUF2000 domain-containing protein [Spirochaeta cellobiosiphila]